MGIINYLGVLLLVSLLMACAGKEPKQEKEFGVATQELIQILENDPEAKALLVASIAKAKAVNPDRKTNPAQNLEEYLDFVSYCESAMPWALIKKPDYPEIFDHMFQSLGSFYFLLDQPLPELEGKGYFHNSLQYADPIASWLVTFSRSWGSFLDTPDSWNEQYYQMALKDTAFGLQKGWYEDPANWDTFNDFFSRHLKSPEMRPIAAPEDPSVVVSFADSQPQGAWAIDDRSMIVADQGVVVKSATLRSIPALLGEDSAYKDAFANGTFTHSFLNTNDYHRYHFPVGGTIREIRTIQGINPTGGKLWWDSENQRYAFDPSSLGWQMVETRGCVIVDTGEYGLVALLPIGMVAVGSINFEPGLKPGTQVKKGDMLGNFAFGGSDFIMVFQDKVDFTLDAPRQSGDDSFEHLLMGEMLGRMTLR
ncbi:phosphatidylserine decarboxylase [Robiginitalea sp. SC105]|nr:phosphatidylserine decarboxylase [Robiginitalea sp. SC105]